RAAVAQGHRARGGPGGRARGDRAGAAPDAVEPRARREAARDQLPGTALQDQGRRPRRGVLTPLGVVMGDVMGRRVMALVVGIGLAAAAAAAQEVKPTVGTPAPEGKPPGTIAPEGSNNGYAQQEEYRIGPEDVLQVFVWKNETLSRTVSVRPDGKISLPLLGDIQAAGQTAREIRDTLVKRYSEYIASPEVSVIVNDVKS